MVLITSISMHEYFLLSKLDNPQALLSCLFFPYSFVWLCWVLSRHTGSSLCNLRSFSVRWGFSCPLACEIQASWPRIYMSPTLQGRFLTTGPPGTSLLSCFLIFSTTYLLMIKSYVKWRTIVCKLCVWWDIKCIWNSCKERKFRN